MGASASLLMATMVFEPFMPARCWMAPEMPAAMYSCGATTLPVWPTCRSLGCQPASTTARDAPTAALSTSASCSMGLKSPLVPRPPETTTRASVSSGRALFTSLNSTNFVFGCGAATCAGVTDPLPCAFCGAANSVARTVTTFTGVVTSTVAMALPAHMARLNWLAPTMARTSEASPAPSFAAMRGAMSLPYAVAAMTTPAMLPPVFCATCCAAVSAESVAFFRCPLACSPTTRIVAMSDHLRFRVQLLHQGLDVGHLHAGRALRRRLHLHHLDLGNHVDAELLRGHLRDGLLLCLHDVGQRGVARHVEPQVHGDDRRELHLEHFQTAVHLARDLRGSLVRPELDAGLLGLLLRRLKRLLLRGEGRLAPPEVLGEQLARDVVVDVHRLLAHQHQVRLLRVDHRLQHARHAVGIHERVVLDQDAAVGAHREPAANLGPRRGRADAHHDHFRRHVRVAKPERFFHGDLIERIGPVVHAVRDDPAVVGLDLDLGLVVLDPLDGDQDLHSLPPVSCGTSPRTSHSATSCPVFFSDARRPERSHPRANSSRAPKMARLAVPGETEAVSSPFSCPSLTTCAMRSR